MTPPVDWSSPDLPPDQFLYGRKGPWPQPSPAHPLKEAAEVLSVPLAESLVWDVTVGKRLLESAIGFPPFAAMQATADFGTAIPTDEQFVNIMTGTVYSRLSRPLTDAHWAMFSDADRAKFNNIRTGQTWVYNLTAMQLVKPLEGLYCAPMLIWFALTGSGRPDCWCISFAIENTTYNVYPGDAAWALAKIFALQAAAYHSLFVVHPALHFPMDSVNAITKTAVPQTHPLFQLLYPHTSYQLALDNAVLEGSNSILNNSVQGTWFDPFMSDGYNLQLLFGAGYSGLQGPWYHDDYPPFDYMKPQMGFGNIGQQQYYGKWLADYFAPFLYICEGVAENILTTDPNDTYVKRWARYCSSYVKGFPDEREILDKQCLARAMAIFMWDTTVSHGGDHYSFMMNIPACYKFMRIRVAPPAPPPVPPPNQPGTVGDVATRDDLYRTELGQLIFFGPHAMKPNLSETYYASTNPVIQARQLVFHLMLNGVSNNYSYGLDKPFMPLLESQVPNSLPYPAYILTPYELTIPASIQY